MVNIFSEVIFLDLYLLKHQNTFFVSNPLFMYHVFEVERIYLKYVYLDHKTSLKCTFFKSEMYTSYESLINKLSIDVLFVRIWQAEIQLLEYLESEGAKKSKYWENRLYSCPNEVLSNAHY